MRHQEGRKAGTVEKAAERVETKTPTRPLLRVADGRAITSKSSLRVQRTPKASKLSRSPFQRMGKLTLVSFATTRSRTIS